MPDEAYSRMRRVNSTIRHVLADEVERLKDPRVQWVTVTGVETSPDLRRAVVFYSTLDLAKSEEAREGLDHAAPRLRKALGRRVRFKYTPALEFALDQGVAGGERIDAILRRIAREAEEDRDDSDT